MHLPSHSVRYSLVLLLVILSVPVLSADSPVTVRLADGKRLHAMIDRKTDPDNLWLTTSLSHGTLAQAIPWEQVGEVEIDGRTFEGRVVRAVVAVIREKTPLEIAEPAAARLVRLDSKSLRTRGPAGHIETELPTLPPPATSPAKVHAVAVSAELANWDQDVAADGLVVELTPYDREGNPTACDGTVDFRLEAWKTTGHDGRLTMSTERWTCTVRAGDFDSGSLVFRLPLRTVQPQASSDWWPHGVLQVRLSVPGSGVIERTLSDLRLRPFEPMRDWQEQRTSYRHFPGENYRRQAWIPSR